MYSSFLPQSIETQVRLTELPLGVTVNVNEPTLISLSEMSQLAKLNNLSILCVISEF